MAEILVVGLGEISGTHLQAIEQFPDEVVVAGVDIDTSKNLAFKSHKLPVYSTSVEAIRELTPDTVVIATSTPTHFDVCQEIFEATEKPLTVLVEKPCADSLTKVKSLLNNTPSNVTLHALHHFAYHPEVLWTAAHFPDWIAKFGEVVTYEAVFEDPKEGDENAKKRQVLVSSWLDSGINALSIAQAMIDVASAEFVDLHVEDKMSARMDFHLSRITGSIVTQWRAEKPVFSTQIGFKSGARLILDHLNVTAALVNKGESIDYFDNPGLPRRLSQYINMYKDIFVNSHAKFDKETTLRLYELLFSN